MTPLRRTRAGAGSASLKSWHFEQRRLRFLRNFKLFAALLLMVCFWYAVPYQFPLQLDPNPVRAAADEASAFQGSLSRQVAMPTLLALCFLSTYFLPLRHRVQKSKLLWWAVGYCVWAFASLIWSADPSLTGKRLAVFGIDLIAACTLARLLSWKELAVLGFVATASVAVLALWADAIMLHAFRPGDPDYRFMGVMTANFQAMNLFVCLICGLCLLSAQPQLKRWLGPLLALFAGLLFLTRARIGALLFALCLTCTAVLFVRRHCRPHTQLVLALLVTCCLLPLLLYAAGTVGEGALTAVFMMGRHDTENTSNLSNRAPLWQELLTSVGEQPVLGCGFDAFWSPQRVQKISLDQGWVVPNAHNTYLDQTLSLGLIGGVLYLGTMTGAWFAAVQRYRRRPDPFHLLPVFLLGWLMLLSASESIPLSPYLPTLLAYSCVARMCMRENEEIGTAKTAASRVRSGITGASIGWRNPRLYEEAR